MNFRGFMAQNKTKRRLVRRRGRTSGRGFCKAIVMEKKGNPQNIFQMSTNHG